jgi:hypothetical protein
MRASPSRENIQHGAANSRAQLQKALHYKDFWNETRIFAANFWRMFLRIRRLGKTRFFRTIFGSTHTEISALILADQPVWFGGRTTNSLNLSAELLTMLAGMATSQKASKRKRFLQPRASGVHWSNRRT